MKKLLLFLVCMIMSSLASAHDIEVANAYGVTIYYNYTNNDTELEVTYRGQSYASFYGEYEGNVVIPEEVTYMNRTRRVTSIGYSAFADCSRLTSVTIPNSVTSIVIRAFAGCRGLTSVTIPNSVTSIGGDAFSYCTGLTSVTIPNSVTSIGSSAFYGCSSLTSIIVANENPIYDSRDNCNAIIETASNTLITGCQNTVIPYSVTSIGDCAFGGCSRLTSVIIPNSVTSIESNAFSRCNGLTSVVIPNSVTSIGVGTFSECTGLTSITIPNSVTEIGGRAFYGADIPTIISLIENPFSIYGKSSTDDRTFSLNTFNNATLYVPKGTIDKYRATEGWKDFVFIEEDDFTGITFVENVQLTNEKYFDYDGREIPTLQKGMNIVKKANEQTIKVFVK